MTYKPTPQKEKGGQKEAWVADETLRELFKQVLIEIKIMNLHLAKINGEVFKEQDVK